MNLEKDEKGLTLYNDLRSSINEIQDYTIRNVLRISYLFGTQPEELFGRGKDRKTVTGSDFQVVRIEDTDALLLEVKTVKGAKQKRTIALPLGNQYEPMTELILNYVEEKGGDPVWDQTYENLSLKMKKENILKSIMIPTRPYRDRKNEELVEKKVNFKHFAEIRELELSLCHGFNEVDLKVFNGDIASIDYQTYYHKLLSRSDYFYSDDVYNSLYLKNVVFNPQNQEKYNYREYMEIQKMIKRKQVRLDPVQVVNIDLNVDISKITAGQSGTDPHKILMANAVLLMGANPDGVVYERENLDVVDLEKGIVVECAQTFARKLLGTIHQTFEEIKDMRQFWILQAYNKKYESKLYKFHI